MKGLLRIKDSIVVKWSVSPSPLPQQLHIPLPYLCLHFSEPLSGFTFTRPWRAGCLSIFNCLPNSLSAPTYLSIYTSLLTSTSASWPIYITCLIFYTCLPVCLCISSSVSLPVCLLGCSLFISCLTHLLTARLLSAYLASQAIRQI